jgi:hypothetical protein
MKAIAEHHGGWASARSDNDAVLEVVVPNPASLRAVDA